jgi:hypothetical protein
MALTTANFNFRPTIIARLIVLSFLIILSIFIFIFLKPQNTITIIKEEVIRNQRERQILTHLVIPLHIKQIDRMKNYFKLWKQYPPCIKLAESKSNAFNPPLASGVKLVVQACSEDDITEKDKSDLIADFPKALAKCISSVEVKVTNLSKDTYLGGSRKMFEDLITNELGLEDPAYIFYMEPDCRPIRPGWLQAIDSQVRWPNAPFWMKGSAYRGQNATKAFTNCSMARNHINGNAIYNLQDRRFPKFYFLVAKRYVSRWFGLEGAAYDLDFSRLFYHALGSYYAEFQEFFVKFQHSEFIQNQWHSNYRLADILANSTETFIIHGGTEIK